MRPHTVVFLRESALAAAAFVAGNYVWYWTSFLGLRDFFQPKDYLESSAIHFELVFMGVALGVLVVIVDRVTDRPGMRRRPVLAVVALKTVVFLGAVIALEFVVTALVPILLGMDWSQLLRIIRTELTSAYVATVFGVMVMLAFVISLGIQVRRLVGPGVFWPLLIGRYQRPRTEVQVFLFMDLESSTTLAESLGHERYSEFLQSCFRDLTDVALKNDARVYQYIGDEVVLHWPAADPQAPANAVRSFFGFAETLRNRAPEYESRFGARPVFRGGVGAGSVTVAEIGEIKRSIAFIGDPLNTAARILELCKQNDGELFVPDDIWKAVAADPAYESPWAGDVLLRGKEERVAVRGVTCAT
jgi:adenylate cyclase